MSRPTRDSRYSKSCWQLSIVCESNNSSIRTNGSVTSVSPAKLLKKKKKKKKKPLRNDKKKPNSPNSVKTKARSRRLHRDENLSREGGSIYDFGKPRVHLTAKRKSKNTAISYRISFVAHSASALKSWEGHDSGSRRIVPSK